MPSLHQPLSGLVLNLHILTSGLGARQLCCLFAVIDQRHERLGADVIDQPEPTGHKRIFSSVPPCNPFVTLLNILFRIHVHISYDQHCPYISHSSIHNRTVLTYFIAVTSSHCPYICRTSNYYQYPWTFNVQHPCRARSLLTQLNIEHSYFLLFLPDVFGGQNVDGQDWCTLAMNFRDHKTNILRWDGRQPTTG